MFHKYRITFIALAFGLTFLANALPTRPALADSDKVANMGKYAGWLTACGALDKRGTTARRAFEAWANHSSVFGNDPDQAIRFMKFYDFAIGQHGWADNNYKICSKIQNNQKNISAINGWLNHGLDLVGMPKLPEPPEPKVAVRKERDKSVCNEAITLKDGEYVWDYGRRQYQIYADEARRRGFTPNSCAILMGLSVASSKKEPSGKGDVEARLAPQVPGDQTVTRHLIDGRWAGTVRWSDKKASPIEIAILVENRQIKLDPAFPDRGVTIGGKVKDDGSIRDGWFITKLKATYPNDRLLYTMSGHISDIKLSPANWGAPGIIALKKLP